MKNKILTAILLLLATNANAQNFWNTEARDNYNLLEAGYMTDTGFNGAFGGYKHGWNITGKTLPLYIEPGVYLQYSNNPWIRIVSGRAYVYDGARVGLAFPIDFTYKLKSGDFCLYPVLGPTFRFTINWCDYKSEFNFIFGWDIGARIQYKKATFSYVYTKAITGASVSNHSVGAGYSF